MIRIATDENFNGDLLNGLLRRLPDVDVVRVQDTEMYQASDADLLAWLAQEDRVLLTHDLKTMPGHMYDRIDAELYVPGIIEVRETVSMGRILDDLEVYVGAGEPEDLEYAILYVPAK